MPEPMQEDDAAHGPRWRANLAGALFLIVLTGLAVWTVRLFVQQEALQRCLDARRFNCFELDAAPREGVRAPAR